MEPFDPELERPRPVDAPFVLTDEMPGTKHPGNRRIYTSKAAFRRATKALGLEEIGNEEIKDTPQVRKEDPKLEEDIGRAYTMVRDGMAPLSEFDKERCKIINKNLENYNHDNRERNSDGTIRE